MELKSALENSPQMWNGLLQEDSYLSDENEIVVERMCEAQRWLRNSKFIVNLGSGQGFFEKRHLSSLRYKLFVCADLSISGLKRLKSDLVSSVNLSVTSLPFKNKSFDSVMCMEVLEHIDKRLVSKAYSEIKRITLDAGVIVLSVPVYEPVSLVNHPVGHLRKYVPEEFFSELRLNGFEIMRVKYFYAFSRFRRILSFLSFLLKLRRPSVVMVLCHKKIS